MSEIKTISAGPFCFWVDPDGHLFQTNDFAASDKPEERLPAYPTWGDGWVFEPALSVVHADGNTSLDLRFVEARRDGDATVIALKDPAYPFEVNLHFIEVAKWDLVECWTTVSHQEPAAVRLDSYASSSVDLGKGDLWLTQFHGDWADEANMVEEKLTPGIKILDSKLGVRAHQFRSPWFLVSKGQPANEDSGEVWGGSLAWSGSFRFVFEGLPNKHFRAIAGIHPHAAAYHVEPGETFTLPKMVWARSTQGTGHLSRQIHGYVRENILRNADRSRAVLLNNWEATYFAFDEAKIISLFDGAKALGFELFLLDDGWFGEKHPRDGDHQGLGDWVVDKKKLPNGISALTAATEEKGLRFGLWFEPEMVNPKSALFEAHPDWLIRQPKRELELQRNQMILDLTNPEVQAFAYQILHRHLTENPLISYVKWDCNRYVTQPGSPYLAPDRQSHLWVDYVNALYRIMDRLATEHPEVELMMCSGGGGRVDYGAMRFAHEVWPTDMTDPVRRIFIQWGYSFFFPAVAMACHVTGWGERPIKFALDVAMSGRLGMDMDLSKLSEEDLQFAKRAIAQYKEIRETVQQGDLYRMESPYEGPRTSLLISRGSQAVLCVYALGDVESSELMLKGIDSSKRYQVSEINVDGSESWVLEVGQAFPVPAMQNLSSHVYVLRAV